MKLIFKYAKLYILAGGERYEKLILTGGEKYTKPYIFTGVEI